MRYPSLFQFPVLLATLMALTSLAQAKEPKLPSIPTGIFEVRFTNGVVQKCEFPDNQSVRVSQKNRNSTGSVEASDGKIIIRYEDDRLEHWYPVDQAWLIYHWHPASELEKTQPVTGLAEKVLEGTVEVHEWGTFTVLQGSDGKAIQWYQAPHKLVDLPPFVQQQFTPFGKARSPNLFAGLDSVRMETPVLYFYPEKEMDIRVSASFPSGRITEVFPPSSYSMNPAAETIWRGRLLPPDAPEKSRIPTASGPKGRHYAAARAVPEAWLFSQLTPEKEEAKKPDAKPLPAPIDHFIFYRGAGNADQFPIRAVEQESPGAYNLYNYYYQTIPRLFALRVVDGQSSWTTIDQLHRMKYDSKTEQTLNVHSLVFPEETQDVKDTAKELREAMVAALHSEGLTLAEAKAMVATWDNLWFTDPGTRVLAILPQSFADNMVPLHISPKPTKVERVFVARLELLSRAKEEILTRILNPAGSVSKETASEELAALKLGRYSAGGMARATTLINAEIEKRFANLEKIQKDKEASKEASAMVTE